MLYLVGIGLTKADLPGGAIDICKKCDLFADRYTTYVTDERIEQIEYITDKQVRGLDRAELEENLSKILDSAKSKDVAILVGGDPLVATTHKIIFIAAKKAGVPVRVLHAASVLSVLMGESGLDFYRFGQICTISRWTEHYTPVSFYETIQRNQKNNLHSIVLLDYDISNYSSLVLKEALMILEKAEESYKGKVIDDKTKIMVMHKVTFPNEKKIYTTIKEAEEIVLDEGATSIIIPAKLSDIEKEIVDSLY